MPTRYKKVKDGRQEGSPLVLNLFPTIYQCTPPPVWKGIRKTSENILAGSRVLLTGIVVQVITKKQTSIVLKPFIIIAKSIAVRTTKGFVIQLSN